MYWPRGMLEPIARVSDFCSDSSARIFPASWSSGTTSTSAPRTGGTVSGSYSYPALEITTAITSSASRGHLGRLRRRRDCRCVRSHSSNPAASSVVVPGSRAPAGAPGISLLIVGSPRGSSILIHSVARVAVLKQAGEDPVLAVAPHDRDGASYLRVLDELVHVPVRKGDASARPVLAAPSLPVDFDQSAGAGSARHHPLLLQARESGQILGVRIVDLERAMVLRMADVLADGDLVLPLGGRLISRADLVARLVAPHVRVERADFAATP